MTTDKITLIGIGVTLLIGILNFLYSITNNKKTRFINTITSSRIKWIGDLRNNISNYIAIIPFNESGYIELFPKKKDFIEKLSRSKIIIDLMLNDQDDFDKKLITDLNNINEKVMEIIKCMDLLKFNDLEDYHEYDSRMVHEVKVRMIDELHMDTISIFKEEYLSRNLKSDDESGDIEAKEIMCEMEYRGLGIKKDIYLVCISEISKDVNGDIKGLADNSKKLLKTEWDRVKVESEVGKYDTNNEEWNIKVGFSKLNKILKVVFTIMFAITMITILCHWQVILEKFWQMCSLFLRIIICRWFYF